MRALKLPPAAIEKEEQGEEGGEAAEEDDEEAPEALMPFRLTRELRDAFGPHAVATTFQAAAAHALRSLQAERASRELELLLDPLVDGGMGAVEAHRPQTGGAFGEVFADAATQSQEGTGTQAMDDDMEGDVGGDDLDGGCEDDAGARALAEVARRLRDEAGGDGGGADDGEAKRFEAKVARLIAQATDEKLLRRMPAAWQAWL